MHFTIFVNVKLKELRDILYKVLKDINTVCLQKDKLTVREIFVNRKSDIYLLLISHLDLIKSLIQLFILAADVSQAYTHTQLKRNSISKSAVAVS